MRLVIEHHHYLHITDDKSLAALNSINSKLDKIMSKTDQALADLEAIQTSLTKIGTETATSLQKITELEALAAENNVPDVVLAKIAEVKAQAQVVDDLVPDAPAGGGEVENPTPEQPQ